MTARTHDLAALTALTAVVISRPLPYLTLSTALLALLANQLGGIAPDIDQPTAPLWRNLPVGKLFGKVVDKGFGGHRFLTHSLLGVALFSFLFRALLKFLHPLMPGVNAGLVWWAFLVGMLSHLIMDTLTKEGVPWLLPLPFKFGLPPLKALRVTTGKHVETLIVFPLLAALLFWLGASHYQLLLSLVQRHITS